MDMQRDSYFALTQPWTPLSELPSLSFAYLL
jgi:hypothetical protein